MSDDLDVYQALFGEETNDRFAQLFPVQITATRQVNGVWYYTGMEQTFDGITGAYSNAISPTQFSSTGLALVEINNLQITTFPFYTWAKLRGIVAGSPYFEFVNCCGAVSSSSSSSSSSEESSESSEESSEESSGSSEESSESSSEESSESSSEQSSESSSEQSSGSSEESSESSCSACTTGISITVITGVSFVDCVLTYQTATICLPPGSSVCYN